MIGKVSTSQSFDALFGYLLKPEKQAYIVGGNVIGTNASDLSQEFNWIARSRPTTTKPVKHLIIGFAPADGEVSNDIKALIASKVIEKLGYTKNQYIAIAHRRNDPGHDWVHDHDHIHIAINAIDLDGKRVTDSWDKRRFEAILRELEISFGLTTVAPSSKNQRKERNSSKKKLQNYKREKIFSNENNKNTNISVDNLTPEEKQVEAVANKKIRKSKNNEREM